MAVLFFLIIVFVVYYKPQFAGEKQILRGMIL